MKNTIGNDLGLIFLREYKIPKQIQYFDCVPVRDNCEKVSSYPKRLENFTSYFNFI